MASRVPSNGSSAPRWGIIGISAALSLAEQLLRRPRTRGPAIRPVPPVSSSVSASGKVTAPQSANWHICGPGATHNCHAFDSFDNKR